MKEKEPLRTTGKRYIEMTTAEWVGRLLMPVDTFPSELKEGCGEILRLREEKEIRSAVEWLKEEISKDDKEAFNCWQLRRDNVLKLIDQAFADLSSQSNENKKKDDKNG